MSEGLAVTARLARRSGFIDSYIAKKLEQLGIACAWARHATRPKFEEFMEKLDSQFQPTPCGSALDSLSGDSSVRFGSRNFPISVALQQDEEPDIVDFYIGEGVDDKPVQTESSVVQSCECGCGSADEPRIHFLEGKIEASVEVHRVAMQMEVVLDDAVE